MTKLFGPYKKRSRTASMQLSINAIVILVMAMAVLGLGLGLIRGVLGSGKDKLMNSLEGMDLSEQATSEKPIANADTIKLKRGKESAIAISYYSTTAECETATMAISCYGDDGTVNDEFFSSKTLIPSDLSAGEATKLGGLFTVSSTVSPGKVGCRVVVNCADDDNTEKLDSHSTFIEVQA